MLMGRTCIHFPLACVWEGEELCLKPGREGPVSVMDFGENPWDDFNYRPIVDIVANKKSVYRWF
jgi:hypothetical protein